MGYRLICTEILFFNTNNIRWRAKFRCVWTDHKGSFTLSPREDSIRVHLYLSESASSNINKRLCTVDSLQYIHMLCLWCIQCTFQIKRTVDQLSLMQMDPLNALHYLNQWTDPSKWLLSENDVGIGWCEQRVNHLPCIVRWSLRFLKNSAVYRDISMFSGSENCCRNPPTDNTVDAWVYCNQQ